MSIIKVNSDQITDMNEQGITYTDSGGNEHLIDFQACYERNLARWLSPEAWEQHKELNPSFEHDYDKYVERRKARREVGRRNVLGVRFIDPNSTDSFPYIEFYTEPPTWIIFEDQDEYLQHLGQFIKYDWHVYDMT